MKAEKAERIKFLEEIYDSFRHDPEVQRDIRVELNNLRRRGK